MNCLIEYGLAGSSDYITVIIALIIGAGVIALLIRILKKSGRLAGKQLF